MPAASGACPPSCQRTWQCPGERMITKADEWRKSEWDVGQEDADTVFPVNYWQFFLDCCVTLFVFCTFCVIVKNFRLLKRAR